MPSETPAPEVPKKETSFQFLLRELQISQTEIDKARQERKRLKEEFGIVFSASQIDNWYLPGVWKPHTHDPNDKTEIPMTKIDPMSFVFPFLPPELQHHGTGEIEHVFSKEIVELFAKEPNQTKNALRPMAKQIILSFLSKDSAIEIHPETDLGGSSSSENIKAWDHFLNFARYLSAGNFEDDFSLHKIPKNTSKIHESAHLSFAVIKTDKDESKFTERLKEILKDAFQEDKVTQTAINIFWKAKRGIPEGSEHYMNFEMFFMSGSIDPVIAEEIDKLSPGNQQEVKSRLSEISMQYASKLHLDQITWMNQRYGISEFTLHAGPLGSSLRENEFTSFKENLKVLLAGLSARDINDAVLQIESQGLTKKQWENLLQDPSLKNLWGVKLGITVDLVHVEAENNKFKTLQKLKRKGDEKSLKIAKKIDLFNTFQEKPDLNFFLANIEGNIIREIHVSKTSPTDENSFQKQTWILDDHLPISDKTKGTHVPGLAKTVRAVSKHNLSHKNDPDFHPIIITEESTLSQIDVQEMLRLCENLRSTLQRIFSKAKSLMRGES